MRSLSVDRIEWTVTATDGSGNPISMTCSTQVVNPGKGKKD